MLVVKPPFSESMFAAFTPQDIKVESLTDDQRADLNRLKEWLHGRCAQARLERDRAERREKAEAAQAEHEAMQPSLFDF